MSRFDSKYYLRSSKDLGWGKETAQLDTQRQELLKKYIKGKKVLDIGCGWGLYVDFLSPLGFNAWGLDQVGEFVKDNQKNKRGNFKVGRAEKLPFKDGEFDTVLLFDILEHGDDVKMLKEAKRVAKQRILIIVPRQVDEELSDSGVIFRHYLDKSHLREYKEGDFKNLAKEAGLKLNLVKPVHPLYNETVMLHLFSGSLLRRKIVRKLVLLTLKQKPYYTEFFAVFDRI